MKKLKIAILGLGTVGGGVYDILKENSKAISNRNNVEITVKKIFGRRHRDDVPKELFTLDIDEIINDKENAFMSKKIATIYKSKIRSCTYIRYF